MLVRALDECLDWGWVWVWDGMGWDESGSGGGEWEWGGEKIERREGVRGGVSE